MNPADDLLWRHLQDLPAFRGLLRAVEARFYADLPLTSPVLDLGCGDGHFAAATFGRPLEAGIDPWWKPLLEAQGRSAYRQLSQSEGARLPYPDDCFATVLSNSVLEHIPQVQPVLEEIARVLRPGGWFYFCVPGPAFLSHLSVGRGLDRVGLRSLGELYRRFFNRISRHYHCDGVEVWQGRLEASGLRLIRWWPYFSRRAMVGLEWGHYLGLPAWVCKMLTGRWVVWPSRFNLVCTDRLVRPLYQESLGLALPLVSAADGERDEAAGGCLFFVARKEG
ncbi:MAG TPA: class I SAM-dependent methyltransferase [Chloroflexi bacterium]|nr:class I SAM-dependent methyltransferase [Chloroflexota bacterium]